MPKNLKLILKLVLTAILLVLLFTKASSTVSHWWEISKNWGFDKERELFTSTPEAGSWLTTVLFVFGAYAAIALTALCVWLRGAAAIVFGAAAFVGSFVLYFFELIFVSLYEAFEVNVNMGFTPLITAWVFICSFFALAIAIADAVLTRKNKLY